MDSRFLPVIFWLPIVGELCVLVLEIGSRSHLLSPRALGLEKMKQNNMLHENLLLAKQGEEDPVVPIEEAFLLNDAKLRREMILDLLKKNPAQHLDILQKAKTNDDTEVVHYASTAIMELYNEYDLRIQEMEQRYRNQREDPQVLEDYIDLLEEYMGHGLAEGRRLELVRSQYTHLLQKKVKESGDSESYRRLIQGEIASHQEAEAYRLIEEMKRKWPRREDPWLLLIEYYAQEKQGDKLKQTLQEMKEKKIYLSSAGKRTVAFWSEEDEEEPV